MSYYYKEITIHISDANNGDVVIDEYRTIQNLDGTEVVTSEKLVDSLKIPQRKTNDIYEGYIHYDLFNNKNVKINSFVGVPNYHSETKMLSLIDYYGQMNSFGPYSDEFATLIGGTKYNGG